MIRRRTRVLRKAAMLVGVTVALFLGIEGILRGVGIGYPTSFLIKREIEGRSVWVQNPRFGCRFFPARIARLPEHLVVDRHKPPGSRRIVVLGASAALGDPDSAYGLARMLQAMLEPDLPNNNIQVVNACVTAINSHVVRHIAKDCLALEPDLLVIYLGNNEVIGPMSPLSSVAPLPFGGRMCAGAIDAVRRMRVGQLIEGLVRSRAWLREGRLDRWRGLEAFADHACRADDPALRVVRRAFRRNLEAIIRAARTDGVHVLLGTVASNTADCPPFLSLHGEAITPADKARFDAAYEQGFRDLSTGTLAAALDLFGQAIAIDSGFAGAHFGRGRCLSALGQKHEATAAYRRARDLDGIRVRTSSALNQVVRDLAAACSPADCTLVDVDRLFATQLNHMAGRAAFWDHVHFNFHGNWLLASQYLPAIRRRLSLPPGPVLSVSSCADRLAYTPWTERRIVQSMAERFRSAPFTKRRGNDEELAWIDSEVERLSKNLTDAAMEHIAVRLRDATDTYRDDAYILWTRCMFEMQSGRCDAGPVAALRRLISCVPQHARAHNNLGTLLGMQGHLDIAEEHLKEAQSIDPNSAATYVNLGLLYEARGARRAAIRNYRRALALNPDDRLALDKLAELKDQP